MNRIMLVFITLSLISCANQYETRKNNYTAAYNSINPNTKLQILEKQKIQDCEKNFSYFQCSTVYANIAAVQFYYLKNNNIAISNANFALEYKNKEYNKHYANEDPRKYFDHICFNTWRFQTVFNESEAENLPVTFQKVYLDILKNVDKNKASENLNIAYLCELKNSIYYRNTSMAEERIINEYFKDSSRYHDSNNKVYVQKFINEIYKPIKKSEIEFIKKDMENSNESLYKAKKYALYSNGLNYARKIGLPKIFQDYLSYYVSMNDVNK